METRKSSIIRLTSMTLDIPPQEALGLWCKVCDLHLRKKYFSSPTCLLLVYILVSLLKKLLVAWIWCFRQQQFMLQLSLLLKHHGSKQYLTGSYTRSLESTVNNRRSVAERNSCDMFISKRWFISSCYYHGVTHIRTKTLYSLPLGSDTRAAEGYLHALLTDRVW